MKLNKNETDNGKSTKDIVKMCREYMEKQFSRSPKLDATVIIEELDDYIRTIEYVLSGPNNSDQYIMQFKDIVMMVDDFYGNDRRDEIIMALGFMYYSGMIEKRYVHGRGLKSGEYYRLTEKEPFIVTSVFQ